MPNVPTIPESVTVHLGRPEQAAPNVTVSFPYYIKNVASSEIYPTWPEEAIKANILALISFALNRIYTTDDLDNGVFVFTNLPPDKYKLELYYGDEKLYTTVKVKAKRNETSYKNLTLHQDQKPKKK